MIIINLTGGLGNQMFQYAFGRYLSINHKTVLRYHFTNALLNIQRRFELNIFNIQATPATSGDLAHLGVVQNKRLNRMLYLLDDRYGIQLNPHIITQRYPYQFDSSFRYTSNNRYVQGYWADERYFEGVEEALYKDFTLCKKLDTKNEAIIEKMHKTNSVSIHVRRGDYITNKANTLKFIGLDYYLKAIKNIQEKVKNPFYFIFSDDIAWCKRQFAQLDNVLFISHNTGVNSYKDMYLMSNCKHNIIANSTFSWWGGWLNKNINKFVIKPLSESF